MDNIQAAFDQQSTMHCYGIAIESVADSGRQVALMQATMTAAEA